MPRAAPEADPARGLLRVYASAVGWLCRVALDFSSVLLIVDLFYIGVAVILRYVFSTSLDGTEEVVAGTLTAMVLLGAPEVLRRNEHIGVDILTKTISARYLHWVQMWAYFCVLIVAAFLVINGWQAMVLSRMIGALTQGNLELPVWMLQLFLPLGGALLALVAIESLWREITGAQRPIRASEELSL